jgi:hypothetical protein
MRFVTTPQANPRLAGVVFALPGARQLLLQATHPPACH